VAIKKFKHDESSEDVHKVIAREVRILKMLHHENIIELKEAFRRKGKVFLIFDYAEANLLTLIEGSNSGLPT
jgi:cyclin-dependent kinase-like